MAKVEVSLSPELYPIYENDMAIVVIIDIFRATSAICTAFEHGAATIIPVSTVVEARKYKEEGYLVGAERNGMKLEGFDFGNSPYSYMGDHVKGKTIVLTTTNGTQAIDIAKDAHSMVVGAFTNISALCEHLISQTLDVLLLCAGWKGRFNLEDALFAGAVADRLSHESSIFDQLSDSALATKYLYHAAYKDPYKFLWNSSHRRRLSQLNLKKDIKYCLQMDRTEKIPVLNGSGKLVVLET